MRNNLINLMQLMESYIKVKVNPRAQCTEIFDILEDGTYKIRINEPPDKGKANKALVKYLSKILSIPKSRIKIISGERSREKILKIQGIKKERLDTILLNAVNESKGSRKDTR